MNAEDVISKYYDTGSRLYDVLVQHGKDVAGMAVLPDHSIDNDFIVEASMLHDIGIFLVDLPELDCHGNHPYICHGHLGRELLENMGLPGIGITIDDIKTHQLPLPPRDMSPITIEEQIICYADKFFSKNKNGSSRKKSVEKILQELEKYGHDKALQFQSWIEMFNNTEVSDHNKLKFN
ncbi:MAG: phosphohydrolase [Deltaproteobacteria bacterium]|nr:phosphohydrolase [Deltaproteobacteria bacterium]